MKGMYQQNYANGGTVACPGLQLNRMFVAAQPFATGGGAFYQLLTSLTRTKHIEDVYQAVITYLPDITGADRVAILIADDEGVMRFHGWDEISAECREAFTGYSPWPKGAQNAQPVPVSNVLSAEILSEFRDILTRENIASLVFVPLSSSSGVFGMLTLYFAEAQDWTEEELAFARAVADSVALAVEHKRAHSACLENEQRLQAILDHAPAVIFMKDTQGRYILVNRRFEDLFHVSKASVIGRSDFDVFPAATALRFQENDRKVLAEGVPLTIEEYVHHEDGAHTYLSIKFPIQTREGSIAAVGGISSDITDRKKLEADAMRLAAIVESADDAIISKDLNGTVTSWNKGAERIFGYEPEEIMGKPISVIAAEDRVNEMPAILDKIRHGQYVRHYETRRRRKDGSTIEVSLSVSPVRNLAGEIIGASKIARDITDRKRAEQERAELLAREQDARKTAELLNRVGPLLAVELDREKLAQAVTDIATSLVGAEFGALFHNVVTDKGEALVLDALSGASRESFANFPAPGSTPLFEPTFRGEGLVRCDDVTQDPRYGKNAPYYGMPEGHLPVCSYLAVPVKTRSGEVLGGLLFGHSQPGKFTEAHEAVIKGVAAQAGIALDNARLFEQAQWAQAELKRSNLELRRANQDLETFAYSASHDLQEPLRNIAISAQLLELSAEGQLQGDSPTFLNNILSGARRMDALLRDLLEYTKATRYAEGPPPATDPGEVLATVLENLKGAIEQAGATVTCGELPVIHIHPTRLAQLFQNLVSNALKYRGKEAPRVFISGRQRDGWSVFSVADNGIGIDPKYADQIFGLFKRLHTREQYPGSGIGLAICQRIVEQYGGRIWLDRSEPDRGSTFCFAVPARSR